MNLSMLSMLSIGVGISLALLLGLTLGELGSDSLMAQNKTQPAETQKLYEECAAVTLWTTSGKSLNKGMILKKTVKIPSGWNVVGAGAGPGASRGESIMVICK